MSDRVQPGTKVDADLWDEFRRSVKERKGAVRGHLRSELETALRLYIGDDTEVNAVHVNQRLARIESAMDIADADGGTSTVPTPEHTHAPSSVDVDERPAANAATEKKVAWLASRLTDELCEGFEEVPRSELVELVKSEYDFRADTAKRYVERLRDHFELTDHPTVDGVLVTPDRREEIIEQRKQQLREETND